MNSQSTSPKPTKNHSNQQQQQQQQQHHRHSNQITSSSSNLDDDDDDDDLDDDEEEDDDLDLDPLGDTDQLSFLLSHQQIVNHRNIYDPTHLTINNNNNQSDSPFSFLPPLPPQPSLLNQQQQQQQTITTKSVQQINSSQSNSTLNNRISNNPQPFYSTKDKHSTSKPSTSIDPSKLNPHHFHQPIDQYSSSTSQHPHSHSNAQETNEYQPQKLDQIQRDLPQYSNDPSQYPIDQKQYPIDQKQQPQDHSHSTISRTATTITTDQPTTLRAHSHNHHQMSSNPPPTNRSRLDPSSSILGLSSSLPPTSANPSNQHQPTTQNLIQPRRRRVSDGSTGTSLRKDILLSKLAEALTLERNKSSVFQKELQNAEHEIDELASQLDQAKREHYQVLSSLKKEIKSLKKDKEGLLLQLEAAEGVDQDEADKYLALIDPAQAILIDRDEENGIGMGNEVDDLSLNHSHHQPRDHPLEHHETVRAQAQKRSAVRARRINEELSKLGPSIDSTTTFETEPLRKHPNKTIEQEEIETNQKFEIETEQALRGRRTTGAPHSNERHRRKLSKSRVESTGGFWRRSGSRTREGDEGLQHRHRMNSNPSECYDSGSLQNRHPSLSHQPSNAGVGGGGSKISKLFRKVFPVHGNNEDDLDGDYDMGDEYVDEQKKLSMNNHQIPSRERSQVTNLIGAGGGGQRRRANSRTR